MNCSHSSRSFCRLARPHPVLKPSSVSLSHPSTGSGCSLSLASPHLTFLLPPSSLSIKPWPMALCTRPSLPPLRPHHAFSASVSSPSAPSMSPCPSRLPSHSPFPWAGPRFAFSLGHVSHNTCRQGLRLLSLSIPLCLASLLSVELGLLNKAPQAPAFPPPAVSLCVPYCRTIFLEYTTGFQSPLSFPASLVEPLRLTLDLHLSHPHRLGRIQKLVRNVLSASVPTHLPCHL